MGEIIGQVRAPSLSDMQWVREDGEAIRLKVTCLLTMETNRQQELSNNNAIQR